MYKTVMGRIEIYQAPLPKGQTINCICIVLPYIKEGNDKMSIEIKVERIKKYKITGIDALHKNNIPKEYISKAPHIYEYGADGNWLLTYYNNETKLYHAVNITLGDEFTESEMGILNHRIRLAGERLGRINQKTKHDNDKKEKETPSKQVDDWSGSCTFEV